MDKTNWWWSWVVTCADKTSQKKKKKRKKKKLMYGMYKHENTSFWHSNEQKFRYIGYTTSYFYF